ncbi:uncharacterized protein J4E78_001114 [Alternaria triticimaculans]|uniref:uncharacterized protein n=1 Tax=Alternaria triticimaculans TaxID=297637 RepID=UPI0020C3E0DA|nr:uncharacterized protein J4E78_001114 [Alternaria triticimaculans]KAI4672613.1 hypothetical protein J4E78_001114 [Alternaria triticimaculans]
MDDRLLVPDAAVISTIFPESQPTSIDILANSFTNCTFKAEFENSPAVIVRIDASSGSLAIVSAIQEAAAVQIRTYVPKQLAFGEAVTGDKKNVDYTVTEFVTDTVTLESVWPSLDLAQKSFLVDDLVNAMDAIQDVREPRKLARWLIPDTSPVNVVQAFEFGSARIGFAKDIREFLTLFIAKHQDPTCATSSIEVSLDGDGVIIKSALPALGEIHLSEQDLKTLNGNVVFSHNDLEPRNLLVRRWQAQDGLLYDLAAIIDWEMAGFFPSAFETAVKDISLGNCNQHLDFYLMFKKKTRHMISGGEASEKLVKAVHLIADSSARQNTGISAEIRRRWIVRENLELSDDALEGWIPKTVGDSMERPSRPFSKEDNDELTQRVLKDLEKQ